MSGTDIRGLNGSELMDKPHPYISEQSRGDDNDPKVKAAREDVFKNVVEWFGAHL